MPKSANKNKQLTSNILDEVTIKIAISGKLTHEDIRKLLHDLRSSANAFNMMVEDFGLESQNLTSPRQLTKYQQLQEHVLTNEKIIDKICDAISKARD